jgi:thioesterase domain-containing protein/aryl carrier-like protein
MGQTVPVRKIEAIFPLTTMQQGLLFHHLADGEDQGFLLVQCVLKGNLKLDLFKDSWKSATDRHPILRTSVHWKGIQNPVMVVRPDISVELTYLDWSGTSLELQGERFDKLKKDQREAGVNLERNPLSQINLIRIDKDTHYFLWGCHHLVLDGWSASIILHDVMTFYDAFCDNREARLEAIPTYKSYLNWSRNNSIDKAVSFWRSELANFKPAARISLTKSNIDSEAETHRISLSEGESERLKKIAKNARITTNSLFMGIWALLLGRYSRVNDVVFGTTVSGRSSDFPNIHLMAGMFMNVLPVRSKFDLEMKAIDGFKTIQDQQQKARKFEYMGLDGILTSIDWQAGVPLFESLFVFENFPLKAGGDSHLEIDDFKSGVTTTYPFTLIVKPGSCFTIDLLVEKDKISTSTSAWFVACLRQLIAAITVEPDATSTFLLGSLAEPPARDEEAIEDSRKEDVAKKFIAPRTPTEIKLAGVWEKAFGFGPIGVEDNFFDLGGDSILSIQIILRARKFGISLSANQIFDHQTLAELSKYVSSNNKELKPYEHVVEIKAEGSKAPLFCLHTGGSHFFFYNLLAKYLDPDRPIYAVQASSVKDEVKLHRSIEEMAIAFVDEIKRVQPNGPYHIMSYCFSTAVGLEIVHIFNKKSERVHYLVVDTSSINQNLYAVSKTGIRISRIIKLFLKMPIKTVRRVVSQRIKYYIKPAFIRRFGNEDQKRIVRLRDNNAKTYRNYKWKPFDSYLSLLLTEKPVHPGLNEYIVDSWGKLAEKGLNIVHTDGRHGKLFSEPVVGQTAKNLEKCMQEFEAKGT